MEHARQSPMPERKKEDALVKVLDKGPRVDDLFGRAALLENAITAVKRLDRDDEVALRRRRGNLRIAFEESHRLERIPLRRAEHDAALERSGYDFETDRINPSLMSESRPARISSCADGPSSNTFATRATMSSAACAPSQNSKMIAAVLLR